MNMKLSNMDICMTEFLIISTLSYKLVYMLHYPLLINPSYIQYNVHKMSYFLRLNIISTSIDTIAKKSCFFNLSHISFSDFTLFNISVIHDFTLFIHPKMHDFTKCQRLAAMVDCYSSCDLDISLNRLLLMLGDIYPIIRLVTIAV